MKRVTILITILIALLTPSRADAMPKAWRDTPQFTRCGITYRVRGHATVVTKTNGRNVTIPAEIRYKGRWYEVRAIWDGALKGARTVTVHADLECCESARLWSPSVRVRVTRTGMHRWLKRTGANVTRIHCDGCE